MMTTSRWAILLQGAVAGLLAAILVVLLLDVAQAQTVALPTPAPSEQAHLTPTAIPSAVPIASETERRTIVVAGEGRVIVQPDLAQFDIGVETLEPAIAEAVANNAAVLEQVLASLRAHGVSDADIRTASYHIYPERDYERGGLAPIIGYRVTNLVQVTVRDLEQAGALLEAATEAGANQIYGVTFAVNPEAEQAAEREARAKATAVLRAHAEELATLYGAELGELITVSEVVGTTGPGSYIYAEGGGGAGGPLIEPGGLTVVVRLQATFAIAG